MAQKKKEPGKAPRKKASEKAKDKASKAIARAKLPAPARAKKPKVDDATDALRVLLSQRADAGEGVLADEEPNGQRVIPGAGAKKSKLDVYPGDDNEYVMTLRMTRRDARHARIIAAVNGFKYPATWVLEHMRKGMALELAK